MSDQEQPVAEEVPRGGWKQKLPLLVALLAGLGVGGASGMLVVGPALAKSIAPTGVAAPKKPAAEDEGDKEGKEGAAPKSVYTLDNLVLNPAQSGGTRFLLLSIAIEVKDAAVLEDMKGRDAELRDAILVTLGNKTVEQLADMAQREGLKGELMTASAKLFKPKAIRRIYFPQFVIQ